MASAELASFRKTARSVLAWLLALLAIAPGMSASGADQPTRRAKVWAVVVGVDRHEDALIPSCSGAVRDARDLVAWLTSKAGWERGNILWLNDAGRPDHGEPGGPNGVLRPTKVNLEWAMTKWLPFWAKEGDVVLFYFAGQAIALKPATGEPVGRGYLLPIDARAGDVAGTGFSVEEAIDRSGIPKKAKVVLWLDTSTRGRGARGLTIDKGAATGREWLGALTRWQNVTAWLAADGKRAPEEGSPGPFLKAVLASLGTQDQAHNLIGTLKGMRNRPEMAASGFKVAGGLGPGVSLWKSGVRIVEDVVPELVSQAGHGAQITSILVSADGSKAITASEDSTVRVWNLADKSLVRVLAESIGGVRTMAVDPDGRVLIAGDGLGRLVGWDMALDRPKSYFGPTEHDRGIQDIAFLPGGKRFVSVDTSRKSVLWDASPGVLAKIGPFSLEKLARLVAAPRVAEGGAALVGVVEEVEAGPQALRAYDSDGKLIKSHPSLGRRVTAFDLSADGKLAVVGDENGRLLMVEPVSGKVVDSRQAAGSIRAVRISSTGLVAFGDNRGTRLIDPRSGAVELALNSPADIPGAAGVGQLEFSADGRWLAQCSTDTLQTTLWRIGEGNRPKQVPLPGESLMGIIPAFGPDGRRLIVGDAYGGLYAWSLDDLEAGPTAASLPRVSPARGQVATLAVASSGKSLLEVTKDDIAIAWEIKDGRGLRPIPGRWLAGAFLADESRVILAARPDDVDRPGELAVFDRAEGKLLPIRFAKPKGRNGLRSMASFGSLVVSKSGRLVAAISIEAEMPVACVWKVEDGSIAHVVRDDGGGLTAVDFATDEKSILVASDDGSAKLWPLDAADITRPSKALVNTDPGDKAISAARLAPVGPTRVVAGSAEGRVFLWSVSDKGEIGRVELGKLDGRVNAVTWSSDARWVAASATRERTIRFWRLDDAGRPRGVPFTPTPHHDEQVNALVGYPGAPFLVSGGDDSAVRFWDLDAHVLAGTLVAEGRNLTTFDWLAYTTEGLFDGSMPGERLIKWRVGDQMVTLEQSMDTHHVFQLAENFVLPIAQRPKAPPRKDEVPELKIVDPPDAREFKDRSVELTLWLGDEDLDLKNLRLYQNGVPVRGEGDFLPGKSAHFAKTSIQLRRGLNRFYAMASRPGATDGKTEEVALSYDGPEPAGRLHALAIGIGDYKNRPLKYPQVDARTMAGFLHAQGLQGVENPGKRIILLDEKVNTRAVEDAFREITDAVKGHPEDTVVLFLAGHTDTDETNDQFCLLLPKFPFNDEPRPAIPANLDPKLLVAVRGDARAGALRARVDSVDVIPYSKLYTRLARLEALQRLVIVDACQAGAILQDPAVKSIQRNMEVGSRKVRNSYLLAARRGEPAAEADALKHGLLSYTLLHGMGAPGLEVIPEEFGGFPGPASADLDGDKFVSTDELVAYTDDTMPRLARMFPQIVLRAGNGVVSPLNKGEPSPELEKRMKLQGAQTSFRLIPMPK